MKKIENPFAQYSRVSGRYNSLGTFVMMSGGQESVTGDGIISVTCYNTKIYTVDANIILQLNNGLQDGQLKKITYIFSGDTTRNVVINCPALMSIDSQFILTNVGDQLLLMWNGGSWIILETLNIVDPTLLTPFVQ